MRPGVGAFLDRMRKCYEIVIYTASLSIYADRLLDEIDPHKCATHRRFREHCTFINNTFVKDLSLLGREMQNIIIVDNSPTSYSLQPENAIPILTWIDDPKDTKLHELAPVLELLSTANDVRQYIKKIVKDDKINYIQALKILKMEAEKKNAIASPSVNGWVGNEKSRAVSTDSNPKEQEKPKYRIQDVLTSNQSSFLF